ncbi:MAG: hypothetical protein M3Q71_04150 [Chloroflexota bacterium]|nr:hypothetical protein [Chloroflexota bacterium]
MAKRGNKADSDERRDARLTEELPDSDPWGGLFENPDDWIGGYLAGDPPLRLAENWSVSRLSTSLAITGTTSPNSTLDGQRMSPQSDDGILE